jgi:hypothetical protein
VIALIGSLSEDFDDGMARACLSALSSSAMRALQLAPASRRELFVALTPTSLSLGIGVVGP